MHRTTIVAIFFALAIPMTAIPVQASATSLGSTLQQVKAEYGLTEIRESETQSPELRLENVSYAGILWADVKFKFDRSRHLRSMTLKTRAVNYTSLLNMVTTQSVDLEQNPSVDGAELQRDSMQIRVCDEGDGSVSLTYEPVTTPA